MLTKCLKNEVLEGLGGQCTKNHSKMILGRFKDVLGGDFKGLEATFKKTSRPNPNNHRKFLEGCFYPSSKKPFSQI